MQNKCKTLKADKGKNLKSDLLIFSFTKYSKFSSVNKFRLLLALVWEENNSDNKS